MHVRGNRIGNRNSKPDFLQSLSIITTITSLQSQSHTSHSSLEKYSQKLKNEWMGHSPAVLTNIVVFRWAFFSFQKLVIFSSIGTFEATLNYRWQAFPFNRKNIPLILVAKIQVFYSTAANCSTITLVFFLKE